MPKPATVARPTPAQLNYLQMLFNDLGFDRDQRNGFIERSTGRWIKFLDELSAAEVSRFIDELKERKDRDKEGTN